MCNKNFNALSKKDWSYSFSIKGYEIVFCSEKCKKILSNLSKMTMH